MLLRTIVGLNQPTRGTIELLGVDTRSVHGRAERELQSRTGVQFQDGALFSSLSVTDNIVVPILVRQVEFAELPVSALQPLPTDGKAVSEWTGSLAGAIPGNRPVKSNAW